MCTPKLSSEAVKKDCDGSVGVRIEKLHLSLQELRVELEFLEAPFMKVELGTEGDCLPWKQRPWNPILGSSLHLSASSSPLDQTALSKLHLDELSSSRAGRQNSGSPELRTARGDSSTPEAKGTPVPKCRRAMWMNVSGFSESALLTSPQHPLEVSAGEARNPRKHRQGASAGC